MKIIYLVHQFYPESWTGTEKFVLKMSTMAQNNGQIVKVITYSFYEDSFYDKICGDTLYKEFSYKGIPVIALKHKKNNPTDNISLGDSSMSKIAREILKNENPDIIHVGHPMRVNEFIFCAMELNIPYLITLTDFWLLCPSTVLINSRGDLCKGPDNGEECKKYCGEYPSNFIAQRSTASREIMLGASMIISPSLFLSTLFERVINNIHIEVINHGMSYTSLKKNTQKYNPGDRITFCYAGSLNHHKGIHILIETLKGIESDKFTLKIYGGGTDEVYKNKLLEMVGGDRRFEFCGRYSEDNVGNILNNIDVVIVPSLWYENYPLVLHEALSCNVPVITSNIGGMAEKVKNNINGFTFPVGDKDTLRFIINNILDNPTLLNNIKDNMKYNFFPTVEQEAISYHNRYLQIFRENYQETT